MQRYAVFDLDETITSRGTWGRFVTQSLKGKPGKLFAMWARAGIGQLLYKATHVERISVKRSMLRSSLTGRSRTDLEAMACLLYTSPSPRDRQKYRMPSSA